MGSQLSPKKLAGSFGGEAGWYKDEQPPHPVKITKPFYLQTTEVSQAQWKKVMENIHPILWSIQKDLIKVYSVCCVVVRGAVLR